MSQQKKAKIGRPKLPKGAAKGRIVPVRFTGDDMKAIAVRAKANNQTVSHWIRSTIMGELRPTNVLTHCNACQKRVTALVMVPPTDLIDALERPGSIRAMHTADEGDHIWTLSKIEKEHLRKFVANEQL